MGLESRTDTLRVVLIEDNLGDAHLIRKMVRDQATPTLEVQHAQSLDEGKRTLEDERPDAVLLDLNLPESRGIETVRRVRSLDGQLPIVVLTGLDDHSVAIDAMNAGAQDYLVKGAFTYDVLARTLRYAVARAQQSKQQQDEIQSLARAEKLEAVGRLAAGVVHDFNNLLTVVQAHASLLRRSHDPEVFEHAQAIQSAVRHAASITDQLLAFCRGRAYRRTTVDLSAMVVSMEQMLRRVMGEETILEIHAPPDPVFVIADRGHLEQVVLNLAINARDAAGSGGSVKLRIYREHERANVGVLGGRHVGVLSVSDDGPGMDEGTRGRIFDPFFTTKDHGRGLGLSSVRGIVEQLSGTIEVQSAPGRGTEFVVRLPAPPTGSSQRMAAVRLSAPPQLDGEKERTVLLIEDDHMVRDALCVALQHAGYRVLTANDGVEALAIAEQSGRELTCVITDIALPGMRGTEVAKALMPHCPGVPVLFISGWAAEDPNLPDLPVRTAFLPKPFTSRELLLAIDRVTRHASQATLS